MAKHVRLISRHSKGTSMAEEQQPFLGSDHRTSWQYLRGHRDTSRLSFSCWSPRHRLVRIILMTLTVLFVVFISSIFIRSSSEISLRLPGSCDSVRSGYQCQTQISHSWGQYSPYFKVPSAISSAVPAVCEIAFAQILSRHGARDPTLGKSKLYAEIIDKIQKNVQHFQGNYTFLADYRYSLGSDQLTVFGEQQMVLSGTDFFIRYADLAGSSIPFIRASDQPRVIMSAERFSLGFHQAKKAAQGSDEGQYPYKIVPINEGSGSNTTLDHGLCTAFESSNTGSNAQDAFTVTFVPAITARLNDGLQGANLTDQETIFIMDLCPFETVASALGTPSEFCNLFSQKEWEHYDYYQTLGKYYGFGPGNQLGPSQGVGYVNELIARLTGKAVMDHTSSNTTLDNDSATFPLGRSLYADFGHDNGMTSVFAALGLYNSTPPLPTSHVLTVDEMEGYSAAWTVPFAGRAVFEKMACGEMGEEMVRVLINGRVLPLELCGGDAQGRCLLSRFVESLSFARGGGDWDQCFPERAGNTTAGNVQLSGLLGSGETS